MGSLLVAVLALLSVRRVAGSATGVPRALSPLLLLSPLVLVAACTPGTVGSVTPTVPSPCTTTDGRHVVDVMQQYVREWDDAITLANNSPQLQLAGPIAQLQRIRRDVEAQRWPECAQRAQRLLVGSMDATIDGFVGFMGQREDYEADLRRGSESFEAFFTEVTRMTGGPAPTTAPRPLFVQTAVAATTTAGAVAATSTASARSVDATMTAVVAPVATTMTNTPDSRPPATGTRALATAPPAPPDPPELVVRGTGASGLIIRRSPGGERIGAVNDGEQVIDLGERQQAGDREWRRVRAPDGTEGWAAAEFLAPAPTGAGG